MKSTTVHIEDDPIIVLRSFVPDEEALNYVASLTNCDPEVVLTYATVVITKEGHVRVASPDPHDTCVESILVDGVQVVLACQQRTT